MIKVGGFRYNVAGVHDGTDLQSIAAMKIRDASGLKAVWTSAPAIVVDLPTASFGYAASAGATNITSELVTGTVTGGTPPFAYLWAAVSSAVGWVITDATKISTRFRALVDPDDSRTETFNLTVTDANGETATSDSISITLGNIGDLGI